MILQTQGVTKSFGRLQALVNVDLQVKPGEIFGIAGPNGAGKSTLFNVIAGFYPPTSGKIIFNGHNITRLNSHQVCRKGIARTFQIPTTFHTLTVYQNIVVPISDGTKVFQILTHLESAYDSQGIEVLRSYEKTAVLAAIDESWKEHLRELDDLKQSVQAATYEQKDPLLIYKFESHQLFMDMIDRVNRDVVSSLLKGYIPLRDSSQIQEASGPRRLDLSNFEESKSDIGSAYDGKKPPGQGPDQQQQRRMEPVRTGKKIGRNELVKVRYSTGEIVEAKYKKVEQDINSGRCVLTT